jgi:hypothetical protein
MWIERAVDGYPTYGDAFEAGQTALVRLLGHEPLYKVIITTGCRAGVMIPPCC